jgi:hypothetical protein
MTPVEKWYLRKNSDIENGGVKYDKDKPPMDLIPTEALFEVAEILKFGAEKYEPYNWAKGMAYSRLTAAALRHIFKFNSGEDNDPETGKSHISHAICCLLFLAEYEKRKEHYESFDDRFDWNTKKTKNA